MRGYSVVCLLGTKTDVNVGGALRAAHCYRSSMVFLQNFRGKDIPTDTTKAAKHVPVMQIPDVFEVIPDECEVVAVEFIPTARSLVDFVHPERCLYLFGPENGSIPDSVLSKCQHVVYVPTQYCMNLAATVNVVLYDRMAKNPKYHQPVANVGDTVADLELVRNEDHDEIQQLANSKGVSEIEAA